MVSVTLLKGSQGARNSDNQSLVGFRVTGHAGFAEYGKDIVCAGVSSITQTALLGLEDIFGAGKVYYRMNPGFLLVLLEPEQAANPGARAVIRALELGLLAIRRAYGDSIDLKYASA